MGGLKKTTKIGLVGFGNWGKNYFTTIDAMEGVDLSVLCRRRVSHFPASVNGKKLTNHIEGVITDGVDGVIVCTPPETHYDIASEFLRRRIPVLLEKPMALNIRDCKSLSEIARVNKTGLQVNYIHLYADPFAKLREVSRSWIKDTIEIVSSGGNHGPFRDKCDPLQDYGPHDVAMVISLFNREPDFHQIENTGPGVYKIFMRFGHSTATCFVGNGFTSKRRNFTVTNKVTNQYAVYDDLSQNKLQINGKAINCSPISPLTFSVQEFIQLINGKSSWKSSSQLNTFVSEIINSAVIK